MTRVAEVLIDRSSAWLDEVYALHGYDGWAYWLEVLVQMTEAAEAAGAPRGR